MSFRWGASSSSSLEDSSSDDSGCVGLDSAWLGLDSALLGLDSARVSVDSSRVFLDSDMVFEVAISEWSGDLIGEGERGGESTRRCFLFETVSSSSESSSDELNGCL